MRYANILLLLYSFEIATPIYSSNLGRVGTSSAKRLVGCKAFDKGKLERLPLLATLPGMHSYWIKPKDRLIPSPPLLWQNQTLQNLSFSLQTFFPFSNFGLSFSDQLQAHAKQEPDSIKSWILTGSCRNLVCHEAAEKIFKECTSQDYALKAVDDMVATREEILNLKGHHLIGFDVCSDRDCLHSAVIEVKDQKFRVWSQFVYRYSFEESIKGKVVGHMIESLAFVPWSREKYGSSQDDMEAFFKKYCSEFHSQELLEEYLEKLDSLIAEMNRNEDIFLLNHLSKDLFGVAMWTQAQDNLEFPKYPFNKSRSVKASLLLKIGEVRDQSEIGNDENDKAVEIDNRWSLL